MSIDGIVKKHKILVVDDDTIILMNYETEFKKIGYDVILAATGKEALELFEKENPDIVTLDILMPDIDGISLLRKMKETSYNTPIIMSTAYDYRDDFAVWQSEAYIVKSQDLTELKHTIKKLLPD